MKNIHFFKMFEIEKMTQKGCYSDPVSTVPGSLQWTARVNMVVIMVAAIVNQITTGRVWFPAWLQAASLGGL